MTTGRFGIIPATVFNAGLTPQDIALLALLSTYADNTGYCWPSYKTLAEKLNRSQGWVSQRVNILKDEGFLVISKRGAQKYGFKLLYDQSVTVQPAELDIETVQPAEVTVQPAEQNKTINIQYRYTKKVQLPDGFKPTAEMLEYLANKRPDINISKFTENFILSCQAKGYLYKNWTMAWKKWVLSEPEAKPNGKQRTHSPTTEQILNAFSDAAEAVSGFTPRG